MASSEKSMTKQKILEASITLFSKKGFAAVGVREIATEAGVNLAMISYYFNGKIGILKEIYEHFFNIYLPLFDDIDDPVESPECCFQILVRKLVDFVRQHTKLFLLIYNEMPLDVPEVAEIKSQRIGELIQKMSSLMIRFGLDPQNPQIFAVIGPSLVSAILTQFRLLPVMKQVFHVEPNESYYEHYINTISNLFLTGIQGIVEQSKT
jgi:AcrR family transcriptional regulator